MIITDWTYDIIRPNEDQVQITNFVTKYKMQASKQS